MQTDIFTDLAVEAAAQAPADAAGVQSHTAVQGALRITRLEITSQAGEAALGRPQGHYYTAEIPDALGQGDDDYDQAAHTLAELLAELLPEGDGCLLVAGLGNEGVTPDALGPETASRVLVTRHLTTSDAKLAELFRAVAVVCPGVLGQTGIESLALVKSAMQTAQPDVVIVIDALAAAEPGRLFRTVQLTDTGIVPGSGVGNSRQEFSRRTLGVPVVAVGVPTVMDAAGALQPALTRDMPQGLLVTLRDVDARVREMGRLVGYGCDLALHRGLSLAEIPTFLS